MLRSLLASTALLALASAAHAATPAGDFVTQLVSEVSGTMANRGLEGQPRRDALRNELTARFDMPGISQYVLGAYWKRTAPTEQAQFVDLFTGYLVNQYSAVLSRYDLRTFAIDAEQASGADMLIGSTVQNGSQRVRLDWKVQQGAAGYKIVDIKVEGLSLSQQQRSEFGSTLAGMNGNVGALMSRLRERQTASR